MPPEIRQNLPNLLKLGQTLVNVSLFSFGMQQLQGKNSKSCEYIDKRKRHHVGTHNGMVAEHLTRQVANPRELEGIVVLIFSAPNLSQTFMVSACHEINGMNKERMKYMT